MICIDTDCSTTVPLPSLMVTVMSTVPSFSPRIVQFTLALPPAEIVATDCVALPPRSRRSPLGVHESVAVRPLAADPPPLPMVALTVNSSPRSALAGAETERLSTGGTGAGAGSVTVNVAVLLAIPSCEAVILVDPAETPLARPDPSMVATAAFELHAALAVRLAVLPSLKVPVAENCRVCPSSIEALRGATEMAVKLGGGGGGAGAPTG